MKIGNITYQGGTVTAQPQFATVGAAGIINSMSSGQDISNSGFANMVAARRATNTERNI